RHTRSKRDWSSDVCSSDLDESEGIEIQLGFTADEEEFNEQISELENQKVNLEIQLDTTAFDTALSQTQALADAALMIGENWQVRSEERRVGKEQGEGR